MYLTHIKLLVCRMRFLSSLSWDSFTHLCTRAVFARFGCLFFCLFLCLLVFGLCMRACFWFVCVCTPVFSLCLYACLFLVCVCMCAPVRTYLRVCASVGGGGPRAHVCVTISVAEVDCEGRGGGGGGGRSVKSHVVFVMFLKAE